MTENSELFPFWSGQQAAQERLYHAIRAAQLGTWNLSVDSQQIWWDTSCQQLFGCQGQPVVEFSAFLSVIHEQDRQRVNDNIQAALDPSLSGLYDDLFRVMATENSAERWLHMQGRAYIDIVGSAYRLSGVVRDVTAQVQIRQQLEISKARFNSLIVNSPTATVLFVGPDIVIESVNAPMLRIWGADETVVGQPLTKALPHLAAEPMVELLQKVFSTGETYHHAEKPARIAVDGQWKESWFNFAYSPAYTPDGKIYGVINTATDITDQMLLLKESEQRYRLLSEELELRVQERTRELAEAIDDLKQSNDNLQQFAYVASHDLQEPLRKIQQFGDLLMSQYGHQLEGTGTDYLKRMQLAASRMSRLIRDLLTFSRISTRQQAASQVPLSEIVRQAMIDLELVISESQAVIDVGALPVVAGDVVQLGQLFQNLLSNALKFSRTDQSGAKTVPHIRIASYRVAADQLPAAIKPSRQADAYHRIEVSDNGIGFDERYLDRIFQVFQRLEKKGLFAGTGIGLAICQRVAVSHGGAITASSRPGEGATFSVYLPVC